MNFHSIIESVPPHWRTWVAPAAGLSAAVLVLGVSRLIQARRRGRAEEKRAEEGRAEETADTELDHDPFAQGSITERRTGARRKGNPIELLMEQPGGGEPVRAWILDRSMSGLCLSLTEEAAPGTVFRVKPRNCPPATPWVEIEVRTCKKDKTGFEAGCRFVRTPPWAVLLLFG
jgi:hypothetical protein